MSLCPLSGSAVYDPHRPRPDRAALRGNAACESRRGSVGGCRQAVHRELEQLHVRARAVPAGAEPRPSTPRSRRRSEYIPLAEFHTLARAISTKDTVHHAYSMNWPLLVKGASVVDLASAPKEARVEALQEGRRMIETRYRDNAWEALLALPPVENALNIVDWALQMMFYDRHACRPPPPAPLPLGNNLVAPPPARTAIGSEAASPTGAQVREGVFCSGAHAGHREAGSGGGAELLRPADTHHLVHLLHLHIRPRHR